MTVSWSESRCNSFVKALPAVGTLPILGATLILVARASSLAANKEDNKVVRHHYLFRCICTSIEVRADMRSIINRTDAAHHDRSISSTVSSRDCDRGIADEIYSSLPWLCDRLYSRLEFCSLYPLLAAPSSSPSVHHYRHLHQSMEASVSESTNEIIARVSTRIHSLREIEEDLHYAVRADLLAPHYDHRAIPDPILRIGTECRTLESQEHHYCSVYLPGIGARVPDGHFIAAYDYHQSHQWDWFIVRWRLWRLTRRRKYA